METKVAVTVVLEVLELAGKLIAMRGPEDARAALHKLLEDGVKPITSAELDQLADGVVKGDRP